MTPAKSAAWLIVLSVVLGVVGGWMARQDKRAELGRRAAIAEAQVAHLKKINGHLMKSSGGHLVNECPSASTRTVTISGVSDDSCWDYLSGAPNGSVTVTWNGTNYSGSGPTGGTVNLSRSAGSGWRVSLTDGSVTQQTSFNTPDGTSPPLGSYGGFSCAGGSVSVSSP